MFCTRMCRDGSWGQAGASIGGWQDRQAVGNWRGRRRAPTWAEAWGEKGLHAGERQEVRLGGNVGLHPQPRGKEGKNRINSGPLTHLVLYH